MSKHAQCLTGATLKPLLVCGPVVNQCNSDCCVFHSFGTAIELYGTEEQVLDTQNICVNICDQDKFIVVFGLVYLVQQLSVLSVLWTVSQTHSLNEEGLVDMNLKCIIFLYFCTYRLLCLQTRQPYTAVFTIYNCYRAQSKPLCSYIPPKGLRKMSCWIPTTVCPGLSSSRSSQTLTTFLCIFGCLVLPQMG